MNQKSPKFMRLGHRTPKQTGVITIASVVTQPEQTKSVEVSYGVSFCAPADKYDKTHGKQLAVDRLNLSATSTTKHAGNVGTKRQTSDLVMRSILCDIMSKGNYPSWAGAQLCSQLQLVVTRTS